MVEQPLNTVRVLVTRPGEQAEALSARLASLGATPVLFPTIRIDALPDTAGLDRAVQRLASYDWIVFTSVNGVAVFWERMQALGCEAASLASVRVAAVGSRTAQVLAERGIAPAFVPGEYVAERIADGLGDVRGRTVLMPRGHRARETLSRLLRGRGAQVETLTVYETRRATPSPAAWQALHQGFGAVLLTSASTVQHFMALADETVRAHLSDAVVACIGPITAEAARSAGLRVHVVPPEYTTEALVEALAGYFANALPQES